MRKTVLLSLLLSLVFCMGVNAYTDENGRHCAGNIEELCEEVSCVSKTIVITNKITIDRPIKTSHSILLMIDESVRNGAILTVTDGGELDGFDILVQNRSADIIRVSSSEDAGKIRNCNFIGGDMRTEYAIKVVNGSKAQIRNCNFHNLRNTCIYTDRSSDVLLSDCSFFGCEYLIIITNDSNAAIENCYFATNQNRQCSMLFGGKVAISCDNNAKNAALYEYETGKKIELPCILELDDNIGYIYLTDNEAAERFSIEPEVIIQTIELEKIVEVPVKVEKIVEIEKIIEVEKPVEVKHIVEVPVEIERIVEVPVEVEKIVEIEKPVEVEKIVEVEKVIEVPSPPKIVTEYVPIHHTETVEVERVVEKVVEVAPTQKTAELNGVTLQQDASFLSGYYAALKGKPATRADVAEILYCLAGETVSTEVVNYGYIDIVESMPYAEAVSALSQAGLFNGVGGGRFAPDQAMTKGQTIAVLTRLLGITPMDSAGGWATGYLAAAQAHGIALDFSVEELGETISIDEQALIAFLFEQ